MIYKLADNIISPLGNSSAENFKNVYEGHSSLFLHKDLFLPVEPFCASLFIERPSFVDLCIASADAAIKQANINPSDPKTVFILSTTKGDNLNILAPANSIVSHFANPNRPYTVSNACVSGACAQILAVRLLETSMYDTAVVIGCDVLTKFIVSGFQSFKALSKEPCKPFDENRVGLNLGEAAATIVLTKIQPTSATWQYITGSIHNDANHISGPSRTGEGSLRCLNDVLSESGYNINDIAFVNAHGTATPFNDAMESIAITRAGLQMVHINALKGYYGHTLGAAGILETIISMLAIEHGIILGTKGFEHQGNEYPINVCADHKSTSAHTFIKLLSGFGGTNAALMYTYNENPA